MVKASPMRLHLAIAVVLFPFAGFSAATERLVDTAECKDVTARVIEATNARFDHVAPSGFSLFLQAPGSETIVLNCTSHRLTGISVGWDQSGFPSNAWFTMASKAGKAVTGVDLKKLEAAIRKCHREALKDKTELSEIDIPNAKIECQAFTRDGGGVSMSVWMNDHAARKGIEEPD
jgi:hypothetical protein